MRLRSRGPDAGPAAGPPAAAGGASLPLPPEVEQTILGFLDLRTRLNAAALVCQRWREHSVAPGLLRVVEARLPDEDAPLLLRRMEAFCDWLVLRTAPHVRRLRVILESYLNAAQQGEQAEDQMDEALCALGAALGALGPHRALADLSLALHLDGPALFLERGAGGSAWPRALRHSLRRLKLDVEPMFLYVHTPLQELTLLEDLHMSAVVLELGREGRGVAFPPSLTRLALEGYDDRLELPPTLSRLTRLVDLTVASWQLPADGFAVLQRLPALRRLCLKSCAVSPSNLSRLTQLTALNLNLTPSKGTPAQALQQTEEGLAGLPQLRHLCLSPSHSTSPLPAPLAAMSGLHTLAWLPKFAASQPWSPFPELPPGPYLHSLRRLVVPAALAAPSLGVLSADATGLESLALFAFADADLAGQQALMGWAAAHAALRQLSLEMSGRHLCAESLFAVTSALQRRPALRLRLGTAAEVKRLAWEECEAAPAGLEEPWQLADSY